MNVTSWYVEVTSSRGITSLVAKRNVVPVDLDKGRSFVSMNGDAKAVIKRTADELGMKEIAVTSRIYLWFAAQDDALRKGILKLWPETYDAEIATAALKRLSTGGKPRKSA